MKDFTTEPARLGLSWEEAVRSTTQGATSLQGDRLMVEVPFGQILADDGCVRPGASLPLEAGRLYGFTRDGWYMTWRIGWRRLFLAIIGARAACSVFLATDFLPL